jgi:hypothetical protein
MEFFESSFLFTNIVGLALFGLGLAARLGYLKRMFIQEKMTGVYSRNTAYALMPAGLFLLSFYPIFLWKGDKPLEDTSSLVVLIVLFVLPLLTLVWQPVWLKPAWLQWLEANYKPVLEKMFKAARKMGVSQWEAQVKTQAGLEQWADDLARKHKWNRMP